MQSLWPNKGMRYQTAAPLIYITAVPYTVYGGNPTVKRLMDYIIESLDAPAAIEMTGGEQILDFFHVYDISRFLIYVIQNHCSFCMLEKNGEDFHLGTV